MTLRSSPALTGVAGVVGGGLLGGFQLVADPAGEVFGGGHQPAGSGVVEDQGAEVPAGLLLVRAEQPGDRGQLDLAADVQADRQGVGGGVGAQPGVAGGDDPAGEDARPWRRSG